MTTNDSLMSIPAQGATGLNTEEMPSEDDLETFRIVFELFDRDKSGFIDSQDMAAISAKIGKDPGDGK